MRRKVLMIAYAFPPCGASGVYRTLRFTKFLTSYGWDPIVLTAEASNYDGYFPIDYSLMQQVVRNQVLLRVPVWGPNEVFRLCRTFKPQPIQPTNQEYTSGSLPKPLRLGKVKESIKELLNTPDQQIGWLLPAVWVSIKEIHKRGIDAIYSTGSPWSAHLVGYWLRRLTKIPWVADFRDPWTQNPWKVSTIHLRKKLESMMERSVVRRADFVVANTPTLHEDFVQRYRFLNPNKFVTITNGFDPDEFIDSLANRHRITSDSQPKNSTVFTITHTGSLYKPRDPGYFFRAVEQLLVEGHIPVNRLCVNLVGKSDVVVSDFLKNHSLVGQVVHLIPQVPHQQCLSYLAKSDVLLLLQPQTLLQIPAKIFEYIQVGKPILALTPEEGATAQLIVSDGIGRVVDSEDVAGIKREILELYRSFERGGLGDSYHADVHQKYSMHTLTHRLAGLLNQMIRQ